MPRLRRTVEQILDKLREAEVTLNKRRPSLSERGPEQTYYRRRNEHGGLKVDQATRLKELERENSRLKRTVAELTVDKLTLREAAEGNVYTQRADG
jgi:putative transposase